MPRSVVILGGGAAGNAAAETLRKEGYHGRIALLSADDAAPYDRPNLSKDYLAGKAPEDWIPLRPAGFYKDHDIELRLGARATAIDPAESVACSSRAAADQLRRALACDRRRARAARQFRERTARAYTICAPSPTAALSSPRP